MFSTVDWQQIVSLMIVAVAFAALLWRQRPPRKFDFARDTHCGCSGNGKSTSQNSIVFHARKGGPRQVTIKMK
jgi:hypothetical protein